MLEIIPIKTNCLDITAATDDGSAVTWDPTDPANVTNTDSPTLASRLSGTTSSVRNKSHSRVTDSGTQLESQSMDTTDSYGDDSGEQTGGDSIGRFPTFHFSLHKLSSLGALLHTGQRARQRKLVSVLVAVLEVDGPTTITTKKTGVEMGLLKLIVGDDGGSVSKVTAWRDTAYAWGGGEDEMGEGVRKGDVVLIESELFGVPAAGMTLMDDFNRCKYIVFTDSTTDTLRLPHRTIQPRHMLSHSPNHLFRPPV